MNSMRVTYVGPTADDPDHAYVIRDVPAYLQPSDVAEAIQELIEQIEKGK
jgi:hypothetical protein